MLFIIDYNLSRFNLKAVPIKVWSSAAAISDYQLVGNYWDNQLIILIFSSD